MSIPVLIDTDTGVDDGLGLIYSLLKPSLDVVAVTTVFGNIDVDQITRNSAVILERLRRPDIPLARGAAKGLLGRPSFVPEIHGHDGFGNSGLRPSAEYAVDSRSGAQLILDSARRHPNALKVIAFGPLTNVAIALLLDPSAAQLIAEVVWMGGAVASPGNVTPTAEADAWHDPESAQIVIESGVRLTMVGLDVTDDTILRQADLDRIVASGTPAADLAGAITPHYMHFYEGRLGEMACAMHSPLTAGIVAVPGLVLQSAQYPMFVDLGQGPNRGMTVADRRRRSEKYEARVDLPAVTVIEKVASDTFIEDFVATLAAPAGAVVDNW